MVDRPVESDELSRFLPDAFAGLDRNAIRPLSQDFQGATSTGVEAGYGPPSPGVIAPLSITIWDHGASEYWQNTYGLLQYETEERNGDELTRHTKFRGHPVGETESRRAGRTDAGMEIFVAGRYLVDIQSSGISLDELRSAAESLDIEGLSDLDGAR